MPFSQENRFLQIMTEQWQDSLLLKRFGGTEGISSLFSYELDLVADSPVVAEDFVGGNFTFSLMLRNDSQRFFNGIVAKLRSTGEISREDGSGRPLMGYSATLVPWFWLLTWSSNSRIFQELSVVDILEQVFGENEFCTFRNNLQETYEPREYCVQYRETDFAFLSRLMEEEGIFYYFVHENNCHTMVIADSVGEHQACPHQAEATLQAMSDRPQDEDVIFLLEKTKTIRSEKYSVNDYNFTIPNMNLEVEIPSLYTLGPGEREIYDYPAEFKTHSQGVRVANLRMQAEEIRITSLTGSSNCRAFASGYRFNLNSDRRDIQEEAWVLTQVSHAASQPILHSQAGNSEDTSYTNSFTCMPHGMPYRHPLTIAKPVIGGVQTAFVVGPEGEEIYSDEHGRVKVQFHWDREGENNQHSSCWIRVAQMWAGPGWGGLFIPRIGHEVIVDFIEGDPDRPLIMGSVYNGNNRLPYDLSPNQTRSTIKSSSSPGGDGFNEIRLEDAAGEEEIYIHAQKDRNEETLNDHNLSVGNNRTTTVEVDDTETIGNNQSLEVGGTQTIAVGSNQSVDVGGRQTITVQGPVTIQSGGTTSLVLDGNVTIQTAGSISIQGSSLNISASSISLTASTISLNAPMVTSAGVVQCQTLITNSVVSPAYTPGAGNVL